MDTKINFTGRSNAYFAITKKGWRHEIPETAYKQIDKNRIKLEQFARKNNIKITFTDGYNMLPELHSGSQISFWSNKLVMEVEKKPTLLSNIKSTLSNVASKITGKKKLTITTVPYYATDSKNIPTLNKNKMIGFLIDYEQADKNNKSVKFDTIVDFLQKAVGKKSNQLSNIQ